MASLVSYRNIVSRMPDKKGKYLGLYTAMNLGIFSCAPASCSCYFISRVYTTFLGICHRVCTQFFQLSNALQNIKLL